jgi:hypothetical protein
MKKNNKKFRLCSLISFKQIEIIFLIKKKFISINKKLIIILIKINNKI